MVDVQLEALAVDTRRAIYTMLLERPRSVAEIASALPVSRPAVSQHLKVLVDADLARATSVGAKRIYSADPAGMAALRDWVDRMWDMAMAGFAAFARQEKEREMEQMERIEPVVKTVTVPGEPGFVFELFTSRIDEWWPRISHSVGGDSTVSVHMGQEIGGRVFEVTREGLEHEWGRIVEWEPAARVAFSWHPGLSSEQATHVEITFRAGPDGTEVTLVHDGWEARGTDWQAMRDNYDSGWDLVLARVPGSVPVPAGTAG
jgi:DNA-binding transcriptional ArsR family regulator